MRVVIDTNVLISAFLINDSIPAKALFKTLSEHLPSASTLQELKEKILSKRFDRYVTLATRFAFLLNFEKRAEVVEVNATVTSARDPRDNKFLELALAGKADCIISGDNDLLILNPFNNIPILSPKEFVDRY